MDGCVNHLRIAWLLPTAWFYWQPSLGELTNLFPNTKVFTGLFPGFAQGFENALDVEVVGDRKVIAVSESKTSYGDNFTYLSPKIIPRLLQYNPDIVFSSSFGVWSILALLFKFIGRWKVVIAYEGSSPGVDYRNSALRLALRRTMVRLADACITNSHAGKEYLTGILNAPPEQVFVQPYEVPDVRSIAAVNENLEFVSKESHLKFIDLKRPIFLFVGNIVPRKGVRCLLEACHILKDSGCDRFSVVLVGDGEQRSELQEFSQNHHIEKYVIWAGRINYSDIGTYFHYSDVFVLPTLEDTWGMVVLEAMLLGKPILCSKGAGASELVHEGENGYCFEPENSQELATTMQKFMDSFHTIESMGHCSKDIMMQFSPQAAAALMSNVIEMLTQI